MQVKVLELVFIAALVFEGPPSAQPSRKGSNRPVINGVSISSNMIDNRLCRCNVAHTED